MKTTSRRGLSYSQFGKCARSVDSTITRLMADKLAHPEMLSLAAGFTDNRVLPDALIQEAMKQLAEEGDNAHLQYGMNQGRPLLRKQVVELLENYPGESGLDLDARNVLITNGSQQGLYILVQMLCDPGDIVLVEQPSYFVFLELLTGLGVRAVSLPVDENGELDGPRIGSLLSGFEESGELDRVKLVYLMGTFANPSTRCIKESEKTDLLSVLSDQDRQIPVVEDMAYRELYFDEPYPARSLLAMDAWKGYPVIYTGTFTKPFATGLKVGFVVSRDEECLAIMAKIKGHQDFGTAHLNQALIEQVIRTGAYADYLAGVRPHYREKRDLLESALVEHGLRDCGWRWQQPGGGLLLWTDGPPGTDTRLGSRFHQACLDQEILYVPGDLCFAEGAPCTGVRLSFGALEGAMIPEAARRFCMAARTVGGG